MPVGPSEQYLAICQHPSILLSDPTKPLIVLDLHGTLCHAERIPETRRTVGCYVRPNFDAFMDYLIRYFEVAIWSSGRPESVKFLSEIFDKEHLKKIKLIWTRDNFGLNHADYKENVLTYKDLDRLWEHVVEKRVYYPKVFNASNTILLDDSFKKCAMQPYNCAILRTFDPDDRMYKVYGDNELRFLIPYLERARHQSNIANWMRRNPYVSIHPAETSALNYFEARYVSRREEEAVARPRNISHTPSSLTPETGRSTNKDEMNLDNIEVTTIHITPPAKLKPLQNTTRAEDVQPAEFERLFNNIFHQPTPSS
ncbi:hypothetical protein INT43_008648 [Umbelopsis isabellina]|uniref:Mitochondrial import inner membrane translocase subunit TIM50 n=1 Tax=Mortierella isabellina TaxID=91625 RepID=A0A8H7PXQ8_MORIS|nr:hypothetical protein INT43_008648 [Umbelopsis isabellina]